MSFSRKKTPLNACVSVCWKYLLPHSGVRHKDEICYFLYARLISFLIFSTNKICSSHNIQLVRLCKCEYPLRSFHSVAIGVRPQFVAECHHFATCLSAVSNSSRLQHFRLAIFRFSNFTFLEYSFIRFFFCLTTICFEYST